MNEKTQKWTRGLVVLSLGILYGCKEAAPPPRAAQPARRSDRRQLQGQTLLRLSTCNGRTQKDAPEAKTKAKADPEPHPPSSEPFSERFKLTGFGKSAGKRVAIINGELATVGTELDVGVRGEEIAGS